MMNDDEQQQKRGMNLETNVEKNVNNPSCQSRMNESYERRGTTAHGPAKEKQNKKSFFFSVSSTNNVPSTISLP